MNVKWCRSLCWCSPEPELIELVQSLERILITQFLIQKWTIRCARMYFELFSCNIRHGHEPNIVGLVNDAQAQSTRNSPPFYQYNLHQHRHHHRQHRFILVEVTVGHTFYPSVPVCLTDNETVYSYASSDQTTFHQLRRYLFEISGIFISLSSSISTISFSFFSVE